MSLNPQQARLAFATFIAVSAAIAVNILYLQDQSVALATARTKAERVKMKTEAERTKRLALEPREMPAAKAAAGTASATAIVPLPAVSERAGRFSPSSGQIDRASLPSQEAEMRMPELVKAIQQKLVQRGYEPGTPDGVTGVVTRAAIMAYEHDQGVALTGEPSETILQHLQSGSSAQPGGFQKPRPHRSASAEQIIRTVQHALAQLGYFGGKVDGRTGDDTIRAVREYEMDAGLTPTGRVSAPLLIKLARSTSSPKAAAR